MSNFILKILETRELKLNTIRLRGFYGGKLRKGSGGGGSGDGFPQLPGDVTRWHFGGLTNEMMAAMDNPRLEDADHKGRFLSFKNFAWDGMSGCDGYTESFLGDKINWKSEIHNSRKVSVFEGNRSRVSVIHNQYHFQTYVKISGINDNEGKVRGVYFYNMESELTEGTICRTDGIYKIDITESNKRGVVGIWAYPAKKNEDVYDYPVTIEILPLYPGALVFDGVDDYGVCDNFPILTKEKGYTVVALRQWITYNPNTISAIATNASDQSFNGAFTFEYLQKGLERTISYGSTQISLSYSKSPFSWQTTSKYNGVDINNGNKEATNSLALGRAYPQRNESANFAIWELVFLDHDATEEELTKIKDYFVKTYPWLFFDQAWTVVGKTNEDEDRATIANITGNGNDLVLSNFGFAEGSGYNEEGEYAGYLVTDGVDDKITSSAFKMGKDWTVVGDWKFINDESKNAGIIKPSSLYVYNALNGVSIFINSGSIGNNIKENKGFNAICSNGRAYDRNWTEYSELKVEEVTKSNSELKIGASSNDTTYTRMAFKNFAIYPKVLSKDDCIKAYNYLQTLKAK